MHTILHRLLAAGCKPSSADVVNSAVADSLPTVVQAAGMDSAEAAATVATIFAQFDTGRSAGYSLVGTVSGLGVRSLTELDIIVKLRAMVDDKKAGLSRETALLAIQLLATRLGRVFEPYMAGYMKQLLVCVGETAAGVRDAAEQAAQAIAASIAPSGASLLIAPLLEASGDKSWKKKETALQLLTLLAQRAPKQLGRQMPAVVPVLQAALQDTHVKVSAAASATLGAVAQVITQPEIVKNMDVLIEALTKPDQKTAACLEKLMETTFCNPMDVSALSVVVPVVTRGLRERSAELKKIAAMTAGNIFQLVQEARDMKPFVPVILPEVTKAVEHSHPDVRRAAERAKEKLLSGAEISDGMPEPEAKVSPVAEHVLAQLHGKVPAAVAEYVAEEAALMLEEHFVARELAEVLAPVMQGYLDAAAVSTLCVDAQRVDRENNVHLQRFPGK